MSEDTFLKVRGIIIILVLSCISLILWEGQILKMLNSMLWSVCGMGFAGVLYGIYTRFLKQKV